MEDPLAAAPPSPSAGAAASPVATIQRRIVVWVDGAPVLASVPLVTKQTLNDLYLAAAAQPYIANPHDPQDAQYEGLTCAEVMVRKQIILAARTGDAEIVMDRLLGRPKQTVESTKLSLTYEDKLKEIARQESLRVPAHPIDAETA